MPGVVTSMAPRSVLTLDGEVMAVQEFEGGHARGEVVSAIVGPQQEAKKHIARVVYEPVSLKVAAPIPDPLATWLDAWSAGKAEPKDGSGAHVTLDGTVLSERTFQRALISEVTIPAMDGASKEAAYFTVRVQADRVAYGKRDVKIANFPPVGRQKAVLASGFRLALGTLPPGAVVAIDAFTIRQSVTVAQTGRDLRLQPGRLEFPNLKVTVGGKGAREWEDWFERFVVIGDNGQDQELHGTIEILDAAMKPIGSIELSQVGIFAFTPVGAAGRDEIARFTAELYVEQMTLHIRSK